MDVFCIGGVRGHFIQSRVEFSHLIVLCVGCIDSLDKHSI